MRWLGRRKIGDVEQAEARSPTDSAYSGTTVSVEDSVGSKEETNTQGLEQIETSAQKKAREQREQKKDEQRIEKQIAITDTKLLESYPFGYPLLAAFQSSDSSFSVYRSFDYLHSRAILNMQDKLRELEDELVDLDDDDKNDEERLTCREESGSKRVALLSRITDALVRYDKFLLKTRDLNALQRPSKRDYKSLRRWFAHKNPLVQREAHFIKRKEDLITLRQGREWAGFDGWIESCIRKLPEGLAEKWFTTPELRAKTEDKHMRFYAPERVEKLVGVLITLIIFVLLVLPVVAMYKLTSVGRRNSTIDAVGLLVVFTLLFSAAMSLLTKAKRHELFAASAAYCAVLVVFISNFSNEGNSTGGSRGS